MTKQSDLVENIVSNTFDSHLEIPTTQDPPRNAVLTITLRYNLVFADSKYRIPGVIVERDGIRKALDDDKYAHYISDWDGKSRGAFTQALRLGQEIWNMKFMLVPSLQYSGLDYPHPHPGWWVHPYVLCGFRWEPSGSNPHIRITAVRPTDTGNVPFISFTKRDPPRDILFDDGAPWRPTMGHEMAHALGMDHIKALLGDAQCKINQNVNRCYGTTAHEFANISGGGRDLWPLNAAPWLDRIALHTGTPKGDWYATLYVNKAPMIGGTGSNLLDI